MTTIEAHADYLTAVQQACRKARESGKRSDLLKAAALIDSDRFFQLPAGAQVDLSAAYAAALVKVTGAMAP